MTEKPAFTLVELLIAITVFSIFIAFGMTSFSVFHGVQLDAAASRDMMFELNQNMELIREAVKENKIDFENSSGTSLALLSLDESESIIFVWDSDAETLTLRKTGMDEAILLHSDAIKVKNLSFRVFPTEDPYDGGKDFYQPNVKVEMTYSTPGRAKPEIAIDLESTITSRVYQ